MENGGLLFYKAQTVLTKEYGECRMEVWVILPDKYTLSEPNQTKYRVMYYKGTVLVDEH